MTEFQGCLFAVLIIISFLAYIEYKELDNENAILAYNLRGMVWREENAFNVIAHQNALLKLREDNLEWMAKCDYCEMPRDVGTVGGVPTCGPCFRKQNIMHRAELDRRGYVPRYRAGALVAYRRAHEGCWGSY